MIQLNLTPEQIWIGLPILALIAVAFGLVAILFKSVDDDDDGCSR